MNVKASAPTNIDIELDIDWDATGAPNFAFKPLLPWVNPDGTLDLSTAASPVTLKIQIISAGDVTFTHSPIGISPTACPAGNNPGVGVFHAVTLSADRRTLTLIDNNTPRLGKFFYALWFDKQGMSSFAWDPIIIHKVQ